MKICPDKGQVQGISIELLLEDQISSPPEGLIVNKIDFRLNKLCHGGTKLDATMTYHGKYVVQQ